MDDGRELVALQVGSGRRNVPVANDGLGHKRSVVVRRVGRHTLDGYGNVGSRNGIITETHLSTDEFGHVRGVTRASARSDRGGRGLEAAEVLLSKSNKLLVLDSTGTNKNNAVRLVVLLDVVANLGLGNDLDVVSGAGNGAAKRLTLEGHGVEMVKDNVLVRLGSVIGMLEYGLTFTLNHSIVDSRVLENISQDLNGLGNVGLEGLGRDGRVFTRERGVQLSSNRLNRLLNLGLGAGRGALESEVLEKVGRSVVVFVLGTRSSVNPKTHSRSLGRGNGLSSDGQTIGQRCGLGLGVFSLKRGDGSEATAEGEGTSSRHAS